MTYEIVSRSELDLFVDPRDDGGKVSVVPGCEGLVGAGVVGRVGAGSNSEGGVKRLAGVRDDERGRTGLPIFSEELQTGSRERGGNSRAIPRKRVESRNSLLA